jgi:hypothetical protein
VLDQPFGCGKGASFGYFSLHKQRKVTRSVGAKALAVEVEVAFDNKQSNSTRAAEQAPLYKCEVAATCTNVPGSSIPGHRA